MESALTSPLFAPILSLIVASLASAIGGAFYRLVQQSKLNDQEKALAASIGQTVGDVLSAEASATNGKVPTLADLPRLEAVALAVLKARGPTLLKGAEDAALSMIHHETVLQTANHAILVTPSAAGAASPQLPPPAQAGAGSAPTAGTAALALCLVGAFLGTACGHLTPLETSLVDCGEQALSSAAADVAPQVESVFAGASVSWASDLTGLLASAGAGVICAVEAIANPPAGAALSQAQIAAAVKARAWLTAQGVSTSVPAAAAKLAVPTRLLAKPVSSARSGG